MFSLELSFFEKVVTMTMTETATSVLWKRNTVCWARRYISKLTFAFVKHSRMHIYVEACSAFFGTFRNIAQLDDEAVDVNCARWD